MALMCQGKILSINSTRCQNPGKLQSPVHTSGLPPTLSSQRSPSGFLHGSSSLSCCIKLLYSSLDVSNAFSAWQCACYISGTLKLLILSSVDAYTSSCHRTNHAGPSLILLYPPWVRNQPNPYLVGDQVGPSGPRNNLLQIGPALHLFA